MFISAQKSVADKFAACFEWTSTASNDLISKIAAHWLSFQHQYRQCTIDRLSAKPCFTIDATCTYFYRTEFFVRRKHGTLLS